MIGEPKLWETNLQLLIDLLLTEGKPTRAPSSIMGVKQLPIIACNMDLVFMDRACMPRFGHGSFLLCLESLYKVQTLFLVDISRENTLNLKSVFWGLIYIITIVYPLLENYGPWVGLHSTDWEAVWNNLQVRWTLHCRRRQAAGNPKPNKEAVFHWVRIVFLFFCFCDFLFRNILPVIMESMTVISVITRPWI